MGKVEKDEDARPVKMEKKSKKSKKNRTNDLLDVGDDKGHVEVDDGLPKEKGHKHKEMNRKSESNKDGDEVRHDKGHLEDDGDLRKEKKKRKRDSSENNYSSEKAQIKENEHGQDDGPAVGRDCDPKPRKEKKRKHKQTSDLLDVGDGNSHAEVDGGLPKEKSHKHREKKRRSKSNDDGDEDRHDKGHLEDDGALQKDTKKKKKKRDFTENNNPSEKAQIKENEHCRNDGPALERDCDPKPRKENRKHKHHSQERKLENEGVFSSIETSEGEKKVYDEVVDGKSSLENDIVVGKEDVLGANKNTEREEKKHDAKAKKKVGDGKGTEMSREDCEENMLERIDEKKKKKKDSQNLDAEMNGIMTKEPGKEGSAPQNGYLVDDESNTQSSLKPKDMEDSEGSKGKKKAKSVEKVLGKPKVKGKSDTQSSLITQDGKDRKGSKGKKKMTKSVENNLEKPKAKSKSKRVSFSTHVEVFPSSDTHAEKQKPKEDGLVRGKRFTPEEDAIVKEAVLNYIEARGLGDEGLKMVLNCNSHPGMKKCWQEIGTCIPYRPYTAVYYRAHILFERGEQRSWTPEEIEFLEKFHEKHGNNWKMVADELGKHRFHVKDTWRRIKLKNQKGGQWSQEEYQNLYDLVNLDLQMKIASQEKKSKHGMLRDNIPWGAISEKLSTRSDATCCMKWYHQLTSSLVAEKKWADADDYRLIGALYELDAACVEDVDWDNLLEHRSGDVCRQRWDQMVLRIGHHRSKPFAEQVDTLAKRYCPDLAETREAWDNKPVVP